MKKWELTPEKLEKVRELAAAGVTEKDIATAVGLSAARFSDKKKLYPELNQVIEEARASAHELAAGFLRRIWSDPSHPKHFSALCFYLKTKHGWKETTEVVAKELPTGIDLLQVKSLKRNADEDDE